MPNWTELRKEVNRKIDILALMWSGTEKNETPEIHRKMQEDLYIPCVKFLSQFCLSIREEDIENMPDSYRDDPTLCGAVFVRHGECGRLDRAVNAHNQLLMAITNALPCDPAGEDFQGVGSDCGRCKYFDVCSKIHAEANKSEN